MYFRCACTLCASFARTLYTKMWGTMMSIAASFLFLAGVLVAAEEGVCRNNNVEREELKEKLEPMWPVKSLLNCSRPNIDAATMTKDNMTYFFKGDFYWRLIGSEVAPGYPRLIKQDWEGLPGDLDAALTWRDGRTFFFKGKLYWSFHGRSMDYGYPRKISDGFCGLPDDLDAAVLWSPNNLAYFFKGVYYWRFDGGEACQPVHKDYPYSIQREWKHTPVYIDASLQWENGRTYILKGENYYRYDDYETDSNPGKATPIHKNWGLNCEELNCRISSYQKTRESNQLKNDVIFFK